MSYTARELITKAYYLSQVVSRGLQIVSGEQIADGLELLNSDLSYKSTDLRLIPYFERDAFSTVAGTESYFVDGLLYLDSLTFNIGDNRYSLIDQTRKQYFASPRITGLESLPYCYRAERELDGMRIYLYFVPADVYVMSISGKYRLTEVTLDTDLSLTMDEFYIEYLRYSLAVKICEEFGVTVPDATRAKYMEMQKKLMEVSPPDLSITKTGYFGRGPVLDWQQLNIGGGWTPY